MKKIAVLILILSVVLTATGCSRNPIPEDAEFGFAREVTESEQAIRLQVVQAAEKWLGCRESDESFQPIIDIYNSHEPLAMDYRVKYTDQWCATFVSTVAIECLLTDIIPTECGCQRQIGLFEEMGCWQEDDAYIPLPGDYIYYALSNKETENTAWSDHVGIVVGTWNDYIKVIEGNYNEAVSYRFIRIDDVKIRGYGVPNFASEE